MGLRREGVLGCITSNSVLNLGIRKKHVRPPFREGGSIPSGIFPVMLASNEASNGNEDGVFAVSIIGGEAAGFAAMLQTAWL